MKFIQDWVLGKQGLALGIDLSKEGINMATDHDSDILWAGAVARVWRVVL